jgi:PhnB protein
MPKRSLSGQLDAALDAMLARARAALPEESDARPEARRFYGPPAAAVSSPPAPKEGFESTGALPDRIETLVAMAQHLSDLPREDFRTNLKLELERSAIMSSTAKPALEKSAVRPIPEGHHTATPYLAVKGAAHAIEFYKQAFGAAELTRMSMPDGSIGHAEIQIGDSQIMLSDEFPTFGALGPESLGGSPVILHLYVEDTDAVMAQAAAAGATITAPAVDHDYGERSGTLIDPFGHKWSISTHLKSLTFEQYQQRQAAGTLPGPGQPARPQQSIATGGFVRPGFHTAGVYLTVSDGAQALEFYKTAFGAVETESMRFVDPSGRIAHSEITIGDSGIMVSGETAEYNRYSPHHYGGTPVRIDLNVEDVDRVAAQAVAAGAKVVRPVQDQFYGYRSGQFEDPFGHVWILSSRTEDLSPEEVERRAAAFASQRASGSQPDQAAAGGHILGLREDFTAVTPYLTVRRGEDLINFVKAVFGAEEIQRSTGGSAGGLHVEARIGNSMVMIGSAPMVEEKPSALHVYVEDVDAAYRKALDMGATSLGEPTDQPYGERGASVVDVSGNHWYLARSLSGASVPEGLRNVTPYFHPRSAAQMIDFLKQAFNAEEVARYQDDAGRVMHARVTIGGAAIEMGEPQGPYQPIPMAIYLYVPDVDATYQRALEAGATSKLAPTDQPYGDRNAWVEDPQGHTWYIATPREDATA